MEIRINIYTNNNVWDWLYINILYLNHIFLCKLLYKYIINQFFLIYLLRMFFI